MPEKRSNALGNFKAIETERVPKVVGRQVKPVTHYETTLDKAKYSTMHEMTTSFEVNKPVPRNLERPPNILRIKLPKRDMHREPQSTSKPVEKKEVASPPEVDAETKAKYVFLLCLMFSIFPPFMRHLLYIDVQDFEISGRC